MRRSPVLPALLIILSVVAAPIPSAAEVIRGAAVLGSVSSVVKINRKIQGLQGVGEGDVLYVFTDQGEPVAQITVRNVYSDEIVSEPIPASVARRIRETRAILIFSNALEYGDFIRATIEGTEDAFRQFVRRNPGSGLAEEAGRIADGIVYRPYKIRGTIAAFEEFIDRNPWNYYVKGAKERIDDLVYLPFRSAHQLSGYREFLRQYPDNIHADEARKEIRELAALFEEVGVEHLAREASSLVGRRVKFLCSLHSVLPVFVEGTSVGKKTASFTSPRKSTEFLNFQVESGDFVLWRLFIDREFADVVQRVQSAERGSLITVYGEVFSAAGNAPWVDVYDVERND